MINASRYQVKPSTSKEMIQVSVPGSKSITNRALLIAALAKGRTKLTHVLFSDDSRNFIQALIDLGFEVLVDENKNQVIITGLGGKLPEKNGEAIQRVYVGSAGTAARFLTAFLGLTEGRFLMDSSEQMKKRPMKELLDAMFELGASMEFVEEAYHFPYYIGNDGMIPDHVTIDIDKSSQFLSALLISAVVLPKDLHIHVTGSHGFSYVEMTIAMMEQFGVKVIRLSDTEFLVPKEACYQGRDYEIEGDLSAACYFYGMGAILNRKTLVSGVYGNSLQGDIKFLSVLEKMGCQIEENDKGELYLLPSKQGLSGGNFDLSSFSDQALTLAAIAPFCRNSVKICNVGHIKLQECDRMNAIVTNLQRLGISVECTDTDIEIHPGMPHGAEIETFEDHRVSMAFTLPGLLVPGVVILNPSCCRKTFEDYFETLEAVIY